MKKLALLAVSAALLAAPAARAQEASYVKDRSFNLPPREGETAIQEPSGVAVAPDGSVHVLDRHGRVHVFTAQGEPVRVYGDKVLSEPVALAISSVGQTVVLDAGKKQIVLFGPDGQLRGAYARGGGRPGELDDPRAVAIGPGGFIFVLDAGHKGVEVYSDDGLFVRELVAPERIKNPVSLAVTPDGSIYIADRDVPGSLLKLPAYDSIPWTGPLSGEAVKGSRIRGGASADLIGMAANGNGTLILLDQRQGKVWRTAPGAAVDSTGSDFLYGGLGSSFGSFMKPAGIAFSGANEAVILDGELRKVERIQIPAEDALQPIPRAAVSLTVNHGNPPVLPGLLAAIDCDSTGVAGFLFDLDGKAVVYRKAERFGYRSLAGDSVTAVRPIDAGSIRYAEPPSSVGSVAVKDSTVAVTDPAKDRCVILRKGTGAVLGTFGDNYQDDRRFHDPRGIVITRSGRIAIADLGSGRIRILSADQASVVSIPFEKPFGIATDADENVYVWTPDGTKLSRIVKGKRETELMGGVVYPARMGGMASDPYGNTYILNLDARQILILGRDGKTPLFAFGAEGEPRDPVGIFTDGLGNVYVPDPEAKSTRVYHWSVSLLPPGAPGVTYHDSGATVTWEAGTSPYLMGYTVTGTSPSGSRIPLARTRGARIDLPAPADTTAAPRSVTIAPVAISGTVGARGASLPLPGLGALAAYRTGDVAAAAPLAQDALRQIDAGGSCKADSAAVVRFRQILFEDAARRHDRAAIVEQGGRLKGNVPAGYRLEYHRQLAEAQLSAGRRDLANQELLAIAGNPSFAGSLADSNLVDLAFRVFSASLATGDTVTALTNLKAYGSQIPDSLGYRKAAITERIDATQTRMKLGAGLTLWTEQKYDAAIPYFEKRLADEKAGLNADEKTLSTEIIAASQYILGKKKEAKARYLKIFEWKPDFQLEPELARAARLYGVTIMTPEMVAFFSPVRPPEKKK